MKVKRIREEQIDVPELGARIRQAREQAQSQGRSLASICREAGLSRNYWYQLESENISGALVEETLRKIEQALGVDFGVHFEE